MSIKTRLVLEKIAKSGSKYLYVLAFTATATAVVMSFISAGIVPVVNKHVKAHLSMSVTLSQRVVEDNAQAFDKMYVFLKQSDTSSPGYIASAKKLIAEDPNIQKLIMELKAVNIMGNTQYLYLYTEKSAATGSFLVFIVDADMLYGDEIWPGYRLVTDSEKFSTVLHIQKLEFVENEDEFGHHLSALQPLRGYGDVVIGSDHDLNGAIYSKIRQSRYVVFIVVLALALAITKLHVDNKW